MVGRNIQTMFKCLDPSFRLNLIPRFCRVPIHTAIGINKWLAANNVQVLSWPAENPDLNIVGQFSVVLVRHYMLVVNNLNHLLSFENIE